MKRREFITLLGGAAAGDATREAVALGGCAVILLGLMAGAVTYLTHLPPKSRNL